MPVAIWLRLDGVWGRVPLSAFWGELSDVDVALARLECSQRPRIYFSLSPCRCPSGPLSRQLSSLAKSFHRLSWPDLICVPAIGSRARLDVAIMLEPTSTKSGCGLFPSTSHKIGRHFDFAICIYFEQDQSDSSALIGRRFDPLS